MPLMHSLLEQARKQDVERRAREREKAIERAMRFARPPERHVIPGMEDNKCL